MNTKPFSHAIGGIATTTATAVLAATLLLAPGLTLAANDGAAMTPSKAASNAEQVMSDSWITTKVKAEILANSVSKAFKVGVKTKRGSVTLTGKLPSQDAVDLVKMIAEKVKGVKGVNVSGLVVGA